ncbi:hypothetical protein SAMN04489707_10232 [Paenacidovorax caeni]|uniref:Uncharacterized protein n=1 Tax=Paenacidovorax caeni TaxID=343013 RepID=A0A1I7J6W9_9BURK|nr:hypothetical protein SAMN04489707_10232 [Paenacidovorax caeni]
MCGGPRQNLLDARPNPLGGFILGAPDRFDDLLHVCHLDVLYRQVSDSGVGVSFQRCRPLGGVLRGLPARLMAANELCRALLEGFVHGLLCLLVVTLGQRVNAVIQQHANLARPLGCFVEGDSMHGAKAHDAGLVVQGAAITPGLHPLGRDLQQELSAVDAVELAGRATGGLVDLVLDSFGVSGFHGGRLNSQFDSQKTLPQ